MPCGRWDFCPWHMAVILDKKSRGVNLVGSWPEVLTVNVTAFMLRFFAFRLLFFG